MSKRSNLVRRFPDPETPGEFVTFLAAGSLAEMVGVRVGTIHSWAKSGNIRFTEPIRGSRNYAVADAVSIRLMSKVEREEKGIVLLPEAKLAYNRRWHEDAQARTLLHADHGREEWDDYDIQFVIDNVNAGHSIESIAQALGRSYAATSARIDLLREAGDLPPARPDCDGWLERSISILTPREVATIINEGGKS